MSRGTSPLECDHRKKLTIPSTVSSTRSQKGEEVKRSLVVGGGCPEEEASIPGWLSEGGASGKMFVRNVCKPDYDKKQEHDDEECGNEFRRVSASDTIGDHPFGGTYAKPP